MHQILEIHVWYVWIEELTSGEATSGFCSQTIILLNWYQNVLHSCFQVFQFVMTIVKKSFGWCSFRWWDQRKACWPCKKKQVDALSSLDLEFKVQCSYGSISTCYLIFVKHINRVAELNQGDLNYRFLLQMSWFI